MFMRIETNLHGTHANGFKINVHGFKIIYVNSKKTTGYKKWLIHVVTKNIKLNKLK
jgi:hypothetical protein